MPKYSINEVLNIISNLTTEEKLELQARLPEVLSFSDSSASHSSQQQTQTFGNVSISGSEIAADLGQKQVMGGKMSSPQTIAQIEAASLRDAMSLLANLKDGIRSSDLDLLQKATAEAQVKVLEDELQKSDPDKNLVGRTISLLKQGLTGVLTLAEPVTKISSLIAKAWGIPMP